MQKTVVNLEPLDRLNLTFATSQWRDSFVPHKLNVYKCRERITASIEYLVTSEQDRTRHTD
jgi:hypothetical protein